MKFILCKDYHEMSREAHDFIISDLHQNPNLLLCAATGGSPMGVYQLLQETYKDKVTLFTNLRLLKLDEWGGVPMDEPTTCESFLQTHLVAPLHIEVNRYFAFQSDPISPENECERIQNIIIRQGPIDLCILGLGVNGHLGFNEPGEFLHPSCHVTQLSAQSMQHDMAKVMKKPPMYGMTLGMHDILNSKKIILLLTGKNKQTAVNTFLQQKITTQLPASLLWLHSNVICIVDNKSVTL